MTGEQTSIAALASRMAALGFFILMNTLAAKHHKHTHNSELKQTEE